VAPQLSVRLGDDDESALNTLVADCQLTRTSWVRGAIRAAIESPVVADAITKRAPDDERGGVRDGAGRKRREQPS